MIWFYALVKILVVFKGLYIKPWYVILDIDSVSLFRDEKPIVLPAYDQIGGYREFFDSILHFSWTLWQASVYVYNVWSIFTEGFWSDERETRLPV